MPKYEEDLAKLRKAYTMSPKIFEKEELAVQHIIQEMVYGMLQPAGKKSLIPKISMGALEDVTRRGQLTLIAERLPDSFLASIEEAIIRDGVNQDGTVKNPNDCQMKFTAGTKTVSLSVLYKECKRELEEEARNLPEISKKNPDFNDILLRMYTEEGPFYKKMNSILGRYNDPKTTTDEEKKLALLLNVALHKAGLEKSKHEIQQPPENLYRGQGIGLDKIKEKLAIAQTLSGNDKLASLTPVELAQINIAGLLAKKTLSSTANLAVAEEFAQLAGNGGYVLHIQNPEILSDFYNLKNISKAKYEDEFATRLPEDILMIPVSMRTDPGKNITYVEVMCLRGTRVQLENSTQYADLRESITTLIDQAVNKKKMGLLGLILTERQRLYLNKLDTLIEEYHQKPDGSKTQEDFLQETWPFMAKLYEAHLNDEQKAVLDPIKAKIQAYSAVFSNLDVVEVEHDVKKIIAHEQMKINALVTGLKEYEYGDLTMKDELAPLLSRLTDETSTHSDKMNATQSIRDKIGTTLTDGSTTLSINQKRQLGDSVTAIEASLEMIEAAKTSSASYKARYRGMTETVEEPEGSPGEPRQIL